MLKFQTDYTPSLQLLKILFYLFILLLMIYISSLRLPAFHKDGTQILLGCPIPK